MTRLRIALAVALPLAVLAVLTVRADTDYHRYGWDRLPCLLRQTTDQPETVDLAVFGGSRMMAAFDPTLWAYAMGNQHKRTFEAINMAKVWAGADFELVAFEDLVSRRKVRNALIVLTAPYDAMYHPWTAQFWRTGDFIEHLGARPTAFVTHSSTLLKHYLSRLKDTAFADHRRLKERHRGFGEVTSRFISEKTCYRPDEDAGNPEKLSVALERHRANGRPPEQDYPASRSFRYHTHFYRKLRDTAARHGTNIELLVMTGMNEPRYTKTSLDEVAETLGLPVVQMPVHVLRSLTPKGFRDGQHLNRDGRQRFTRWLINHYGRKLRENQDA